MILKRQEKEGVIKAIYSSSNILASTYNKTTKDLILIFNKGGQYKYPNVDEADYFRFEIADSQGVVFNTNIKKYAFEKLEEVNPSEIINEITRLKSEETQKVLLKKQRSLVAMMQILVDNSTSLFNEEQLNGLQSAITEFTTELSKSTPAIV